VVEAMVVTEGMSLWKLMSFPRRSSDVAAEAQGASLLPMQALLALEKLVHPAVEGAADAQAGPSDPKMLLRPEAVAEVVAGTRRMPVRRSWQLGRVARRRPPPPSNEAAEKASVEAVIHLLRSLRTCASC